MYGHMGKRGMPHFKHGGSSSIGRNRGRVRVRRKPIGGGFKKPRVQSFGFKFGGING